MGISASKTKYYANTPLSECVREHGRERQRLKNTQCKNKQKERGGKQKSLQ